MSLEEALVEWIKLLGHGIDSLRELSDGRVFGEILSGVDSAWFRMQTSREAGDGRAGWVFRFNVLKRLHKLMISFLDNQLNVKPGLQVNLNAVARDESVDDIVSFATLVLWYFLR